MLNYKAYLYVDMSPPPPKKKPLNKNIYNGIKYADRFNFRNPYWNSLACT